MCSKQQPFFRVSTLHFKMFGLLTLLFLSTVGAFLIPSPEYTCSGTRTPCTLQDVDLQTEDRLNEVSFRDVTDPLIIASGKICNFTRQLAEKLDGIVDLTVNGVELETFYIRPEITHLEATNNRIRALPVDEDLTKAYKMMTLKLTDNQLVNVGNLSRFTQLRYLHLDGNKLEQLSMDMFSEMTELRELSLANNLLFTVETKNSWQLLKLKSLNLSGNKLFELDMQKWDLAYLKELDVSNNRLYLLDGGFQQFDTLKNIRMAGNFWKCDFLSGVNRQDRWLLDEDAEGRCEKENLSDVRKMCCTIDATSFLGSPSDDLFSDKWEMMGKLQQTVEQLNETAEAKKQTDEDLATRVRSLEETIQELKDKLNEVSEKVDERGESADADETNNLKELVSDQKGTIENLESKQSDMGSELEALVERLNELRESTDEKFKALETVSESVTKLEEKLQGEDAESMSKSVTELKESLKRLEGQQIKYHISSVDLKSQIGKERTRLDEVKHLSDKLMTHTEKLQADMIEVQNKLNIAFKIFDEISFEQ